jgi:hypothetical protein
MKTFEQFKIEINEADIRQNPAVSPEYLSDLNRRAEANAQAIEQRFGRDMGALMRAVHEVQSIQRGKEKELEDLTQRIIMNQYGSILGEVELDIQIPRGPREMKAQMKAHEEEQDLEIPTVKDLEDEATQTAVHKRKILNMIAQGEAINSKLMLMSEENVAGLTDLFGEANAKRMVDNLVKITEICNARDWRIPEEVGARMIEQGDALSGVSRVEWKPKKEKEADEEESEETGSEEEMADSTPRIIIMGMDQAMLFHEAVKGIYGLINQGGLAHLDDQAIRTVFLNADTAQDEVQDLKRAKLTAADLRDFLNQFPEIEKMENGREYVWGKMIDASVLPDTEFLDLMKNIFEASPIFREGSEPSEKAREAMVRAKAVVQRLIRMIQDELDEYEAAMRDWESGESEGPEGFEVEPDTDDMYKDLGISKREEPRKTFNLDDILDKIGSKGIDSLTQDERAFLDSLTRDERDSLKNQG